MHCLPCLHHSHAPGGVATFPLFAFLVAALREVAALLAEAQVTWAGVFCLWPSPPPTPATPHGPSGSPCNPSPSRCFDRLLYRGHTSGGRKCLSGEKFDRSLTRWRLIFGEYHNVTRVFEIHQLLLKTNCISSSLNGL